LYRPVLHLVIDDVSMRVVPPLPYHMSVVYEIPESLSSAAAWGELS